MGYIAKDFDVERFGVKMPEVYGRISHMELDVPTAYCRLDLNWYGSKEVVENAQPLDSWSFVLAPEMINALLKNKDNQSALAVAYNAIRLMDERFVNIEDDV